MKIKVIIRSGIVSAVLADEPVDIEIVDIDKDYKDYEALEQYEAELYKDKDLKEADFTVAHFGEEAD